MSLEVRHNRAEHTHENEQFRRVVISMKEVFAENGWTGLLIGNPFNESFSRFRADAILLYNNGLIIIDFKDYKGKIQLPFEETAFQFTPWYNETLYDNQRITIRAGSKFINPFMQLKHYREGMYEIIETTPELANQIDKTRTCAANIFSGPVEIINGVPGKFRYYKILQEDPSSLHDFLYDYSSCNSYNIESAEALKSIFPADLWKEGLISTPSKNKEFALEIVDTTDSTLPVEKQVHEIHDDVKDKLSAFLNEGSSGVLVLESMHATERDAWMKYIMSNSVEFNIPQAEIWTYSARIAKQINTRTGILPHGLYGTIYGGEEEIQKDSKSLNKKVTERIIPIRPSNMLDDAAVVILHEAHLVDSQLFRVDQEALIFGSGRLLDDLMRFLTLSSTNRKLICIGDPYSLSYGKYDNSALNMRNLKEIYGGEIESLRQPIEFFQKDCLNMLRSNLALGIENKQYNNLRYDFDETIRRIEREEALSCVKNWFGKPFTREPDKVVLTYTNALSNKINSWIKTDCLKNGPTVAIDDLLLVNNHVTIVDKTGFSHSIEIHNGMYLLIKEIKEQLTIVPVKKEEKQTELHYIRVNAVSLSHSETMDLDLWLLSNCLENPHGRPLEEEQIALQVLMNQKVKEEKEKNPFEKSVYFKSLNENFEYKNFKVKEKDLTQNLELGERVKTKIDETKRSIRKIEQRYRKYHDQKMRQNVRESDPIINAVLARYGWTTTVNKAIGTKFGETLIMANMGDDKPATNSNYFRWLYTALCITNEKSNIFEPQIVHPLMKCVFDDASATLVTNIAETKTQKFSYKSKSTDQIFNSLINDIENIHVKAVLSKLSQLLNEDGYSLDSVAPHGEYLTKAFVTCSHNENNQSVIAINNKGAKVDFAVSSIRLEKSVGQAESDITKVISKFIEESSVSDNTDKEFEFPDDFRKNIYDEWHKKLHGKGLILLLIKKHDYRDVFHILKDKAVCKFQVDYDGKGFITKLTVLELSDKMYSPILKELITH